MPLEILAAPFGTEVLVLELAMRGAGQIAELAAICEPDVGVITNIGPVHLEQLGSLEGVAAAKAELLDGMAAGCTGVVPSDEPLLEPWLREDLEIVTFGPGGDVHYEGSSLKGGVIPDAPPTRHVVIAGGERIELELPFDQEHNMLNALAAVAAARAIGVTPSGAIDVHFSAMRGERVALGIGALVINDCYNANPLSMRAALDDLASQHAEGRRVAVLGDMLELGPAEREHHREIGAYAASAGVDLLVTVGPRADRDARRVRRRLARRARRRGGRRAAPRADRRGRRRAGQGLARRRARGRHRGAAGRRLMGEVLIAGTASLLMCIFLSPKFIAFLREREFGQHIREEGPQEHHAKAGTPTMGGIIIFTAIAVPFLLLTEFTPRAVGVFGVALACALLGFADDFTKIVKRRSLGLRARTKLIATVVISIGLWLVATRWAELPDTVDLRVIDARIDLGYFYPVFIYVVLAGTTSAVNLTDGLDGLAAGCAAIVLLAYIAITFTTRQFDLALVAACLVGACVGFLWFNSFPASIFMGDTGSLGLGGAIAGLAVMTKTEVLLRDPRRHLRDRGAVGPDPGRLLPGLPQARLPDGADPPPLRAARVVGDEDHPALLDRRLRVQRDRLHAVPAVADGVARANGNCAGEGVGAPAAGAVKPHFVRFGRARGVPSNKPLLPPALRSTPLELGDRIERNAGSAEPTSYPAAVDVRRHYRKRPALASPHPSADFVTKHPHRPTFCIPHRSVERP